MTTEFDATDAAEIFFAGAVAAGLRRVLICPGSRSSPLALGASRVPTLEHCVHLDERSAAFAALGEAKASGQPVAVLCTSGTAGVNFGPAIAEAAMSNIAVIAITADRPPEGQHWGVGQSLDQRGLFGRHVREEFTMPVGGDGGAEYSERAGWRAIASAIDNIGPVHVNWPFRLPLEPKNVGRRFASALPPSPANTPRRREADLDALKTAISAASAPVIVAGPDSLPIHATKDASSILRSAESLGIPVLADVLSGLRGHGRVVGRPSLVTVGSELDADLVIHLGHTPTAKSIRLWWESLPYAQHVLIDPWDDWQDPSHSFDHRLTSDPAWLISTVAATLDSSSARSNHYDSWETRGQHVDAAVHATLDNHIELTEAHIGASVGQWAAQDLERTVVASSSMPVRDLDSFAPADAAAVVLSNRGVNGIDGVVASALGVARARTDRVVVLIGDIAALHDVGSILDAARQKSPLTLVIPNNDGGGIFSNLPMREAIDDSRFEEFFHTPHGTDFAFLGQVDNIVYSRVTSLEALTDALVSPPATDVVIVEAPVDTKTRLELQHQIINAVTAL